MGPEQTKLMGRLFGDPERKLINFKFTRGDKPATAEEICEQLNNSFENRVLCGPVKSMKPPTDVRDLVASL